MISHNNVCYRCWSHLGLKGVWNFYEFWGLRYRGWFDWNCVWTLLFEYNNGNSDRATKQTNVGSFGVIDVNKPIGATPHGGRGLPRRIRSAWFPLPSPPPHSGGMSSANFSTQNIIYHLHLARRDERATPNCGSLSARTGPVSETRWHPCSWSRQSIFPCHFPCPSVSVGHFKIGQNKFFIGSHFEDNDRKRSISDKPHLQPLMPWSLPRFKSTWKTIYQCG